MKRGHGFLAAAIILLVAAQVVLAAQLDVVLAVEG